MNFKEIIKALESKYNVLLKKEAYPYPNIQTKEAILKTKRFFSEKRGFFFISEMSDTSKNINRVFLGMILSQNSSDLLMKIASKMVKDKGNNKIMLFQTYNIKIHTGTKLIAMIGIESNEEKEIFDSYEQLNTLFKEFQSILNNLADSLVRR